MNKDTLNRIKEINIENFILGIFIIIIILSYIANKIELDYFLNNNDTSRKKYYYLQIFIFTTITIISLYYVTISLISIKNININTPPKQQKYAYLDLIASISTLITSLILLFIAITDTNIDAEISL